MTVGQRRHLGLAGGQAEPRFVVDVDVDRATVTVGDRRDLLTGAVRLRSVTWADRPGRRAGRWPSAALTANPGGGLVEPHADAVRWEQPQPRVAPGQTVVFYEGDEVVGSAHRRLTAPSQPRLRAATRRSRRASLASQREPASASHRSASVSGAGATRNIVARP